MVIGSIAGLTAFAVVQQVITRTEPCAKSTSIPTTGSFTSQPCDVETMRAVVPGPTITKPVPAATVTKLKTKTKPGPSSTITKIATPKMTAPTLPLPTRCTPLACRVGAAASHTRDTIVRMLATWILLTIGAFAMVVRRGSGTA